MPFHQGNLWLGIPDCLPDHSKEVGLWTPFAPTQGRCHGAPHFCFNTLLVGNARSFFTGEIASPDSSLNASPVHCPKPSMPVSKVGWKNCSLVPAGPKGLWVASHAATQQHLFRSRSGSKASSALHRFITLTQYFSFIHLLLVSGTRIRHFKIPSFLCVPA